jgi:hypothetical protein
MYLSLSHIFCVQVQPFSLFSFQLLDTIEIIFLINASHIHLTIAFVPLLVIMVIQSVIHTHTDPSLGSSFYRFLFYKIGSLSIRNRINYKAKVVKNFIIIICLQKEACNLPRLSNYYCIVLY